MKEGKSSYLKALLKTGFYLFHPLWIPFAGTLLFFFLTPVSFPKAVIQHKLIGVIILSILAPFVLLIALRKINDHTIFVWENLQIRRFYLLFLCLLLLTINNFLIPAHQFLELSYFFVGLLLTYSLALFLSYLQIIISIHVASLACLLSFLLSMSLLNQINLLTFIIPLFFILGWVATERMEQPSHNGVGILSAFILGFLPQLVLLLGILNRYNP